MRLRSVLRHAVVISYLLITIGGLGYTVFRIRPPLPEILWRYSYATMAPFQGNSPRNSDVAAEGLRTDGVWERIDLTRYVPQSTGWRTVRLSLREIPEGRRAETYDAMAHLLLERERARGNLYEAVRLMSEYWYASPNGYEAMRRDPYVERREVGHASISSPHR